MTQTNTNPSVTDNVLSAIRSGKTRMKPRWHFVFRAILVALGVFIVSIGIVYVASLIHFLLRQNGMWFAPDVGMRGMGLLFLSLPWILVASVIVFIIILEILVRQYAFAYKQPLMYSLTGIVALAALATFVVGHTGMHGMMYRATREGAFPAGVPLYGPFPLPKNTEIHPGVITQVTDASSFILERVDGTSMTVYITNDTRIPKGYTLKEDDRAIVFGVSDNTIIHAEHIRPERQDAFIPFRDGGRHNMPPSSKPTEE